MGGQSWRNKMMKERYKKLSYTNPFYRKCSSYLPLLILMSGCASLPDAQILYYPAKTDVTATFIQNLTCDENKTTIFQSGRLTTSLAHSADLGKKPNSINLKDFEGSLTDGNISVTHYPDGRLNTINAISTGRGQQIISSVVSIAGSFLGVGGGQFAALSTIDPNQIKAVCTVIHPDAKSNSNVMALTYEAKFDSSTPDTMVVVQKDEKTDEKLNPNTLINFVPNSATELNLQKINAVINGASIFSTNLKLDKRPSHKNNKNNCLIKYKKKKKSGTNDEEKYDCLESNKFDGLEANTVLIKVQNSVEYTLKVARSFNNKLFPPEMRTPVSDTKIRIASDKFYHVPFQTKPIFGTSTSGLTLTPMGSVAAVNYNSTSGTSAALDSITTILDEFQTPTSAERATEIAQEQRLLRCIANPAECV